MRFESRYNEVNRARALFESFVNYINHKDIFNPSYLIIFVWMFIVTNWDFIDGRSWVFSFFQVLTEVVEAVQAFFHSSHMLKAINHTIVSLIPKVPIPTGLMHFRPISLCSVLYKIISKILVNRLKPVLDKCISKNQAAFVAGRQILDNVILVHEFLHHLKNKRNGRVGCMAVKLNMSKAYDRVEWDYLKAIMIKMGFCDIWINWIMNCITTVSYSFSVNGEARELVKPERGLRQCQPLSPYLFLICSEGFSNLLKRTETSKKMKGMKISRNDPALTYLFL